MSKESKYRLRLWHHSEIIREWYRRKAAIEYALAFAQAEIEIDKHFEEKRIRFFEKIATLNKDENAAMRQVEHRLHTGKWAFEVRQEEYYHSILSCWTPVGRTSFKQVCTCGSVFESNNAQSLHELWGMHRRLFFCPWPWPIPDEYRLLHPTGMELIK